jgi:uroporphyrinogen-III synthase
MPQVRVIVTRPAADAARWVGDLRAAGIDAVALPLIELAALDDPSPLHAAWRRLPDYRALMFVSAAAVTHFFKQKEAATPVPSAQAPADLIASKRYWATGPGTAAALQRAGVDAACIDAPPPEAGQFDSEALWPIVRAQVVPGARVLLGRGGVGGGPPVGRDWLSREIVAAGGLCETVVAYLRLAPAFGEPELRVAAHGARAPAVWLFSSSEAVANLCRAMPRTSWREARAVATHPRIEQAAREAGFGSVRGAQPRLDAIVASIESLE